MGERSHSAVSQSEYLNIKINRRKFLRAGGILAAGFVGAATLGISEDITERLEDNSELRKENAKDILTYSNSTSDRTLAIEEYESAATSDKIFSVLNRISRIAQGGLLVFGSIAMYKTLEDSQK